MAEKHDLGSTSSSGEGIDTNREMIEEIRGLRKSVSDLSIIMKQSNALLQQQQITLEATRKVLEKQTDLLRLKVRLQMSATDGMSKVFDEFENSTADNKINNM